MSKDCFVGMCFGLLLAAVAFAAFLLGGFMMAEKLLDETPHHELRVLK